MRNPRMVVVSLISMFAFTGLAAASASAATSPEYMTCAKAAKETVIVSGKPKSVYTGKYTEAKCVKLAPAGLFRAEGKPEGKYELEPVKTPAAFTGLSKPSIFYFHLSKGAVLYTVACKTGKVSGEIASPTEGALKIAFEGCEATKVSTKVKTPCAAGPTLNAISALVLTLPAEHPGYAIQFEPFGFECGSVKFEAFGVLLDAEVSPAVNGGSAAFKVSKTTGENTPHEFFFNGAPLTVETPGELVEGATHTAVEFGLSATEPIVPKGTVVLP